MRIEKRDGVSVLRLEGGKANAMDLAFLTRLAALVDEAVAAGPGALVLVGYQRFFSGGLHLPSLIALDRPTITRFIHLFDDTMMRLFALPRPVVAAINGHAIAGGCVLALQADFRVMASGEAKIGLNEVQLGIGLPSAVVETLRCQVPAPSLGPIAFEGRLFSAEEAERLGLVHAVVAPGALLDAAVDKARALAALPEEAFAQIKRVVREPALAAVRQAGEDGERAWVDTWFSQDGQKRLAATVARLSSRPA